MLGIFSNYPYTFTFTYIAFFLSFQVFFYKAQLQSGEVSALNDAKDFVWVTRNEMKDYVDRKYMKKVKDFVIELWSVCFVCQLL